MHRISHARKRAKAEECAELEKWVQTVNSDEVTPRASRRAGAVKAFSKTGACMDKSITQAKRSNMSASDITVDAGVPAGLRLSAHRTDEVRMTSAAGIAENIPNKK